MNKKQHSSYLVKLLLVLSLAGFLAACGGGSDSSGAAATGYTVSGSVTGLTGGSLTITLNGASPATISGGDTSFQFNARLQTGDSYTVAISDNQRSLSCQLQNDTGVVASTNVVNVNIVCTDSVNPVFTVSGSISGLTIGSLTLTLNNDLETQVVDSTNTVFAFTTSLSNAETYDVRISANQSGLLCSVTSGSGTVADTDITNVAVNCQGGAGFNLQPFGIQTESPDPIVVAGLRVVDRTTDAPILGLTKNDFSVLENNQAVGSESFLDVEQASREKLNVKTVLILDISTSLLPEDIAVIKAAAKATLFSVDDKGDRTSNLLLNQQVAIYTFDSTVQLVADFSDDINALGTAIDSIDENLLNRANSTNLIGAVETGVGRWNNRFGLDSAEYGYAILLTDGDHNSDGRTPADIQSSLVDINGARKDVFAIAVGADVSIDTLAQITGSANRVFTANNISALSDVLSAVQLEAIAQTQGLYRLYYVTPKRSGIQNITISLNDNLACETQQTNCVTTLTGSFNADGFTDVVPEVKLNVIGGALLSTGEHIITPVDTVTVEAKLRWINLQPNFLFEFSDLVGEQPVFTAVANNSQTFQVPTFFVEARVRVTELNTTLSSVTSLFIRDTDEDGLLDRNDFFPNDSTRWAKEQISRSDLQGKNGFTLNGISLNDLSGFRAKGIGDINGDGIADIAIGAPGIDWGDAVNMGALYVVFGSKQVWTSSIELSTLDGSNGFTLYGAYKDFSGEDVGEGAAFDKAGDVNNDGIDDLIVGARSTSATNGIVYVVYGKTSAWSAVMDISLLNGTTGFKFTGDYIGRYVSSAGDLNNDGIDDIALGSLNGYVIFGKTGGWASGLTLASLDGSNGLMIDISSFNSGIHSLSPAGDVNGDGVDDLLLGSQGGVGSSGHAIVVYGHSSTWPASLKVNPGSISYPHYQAFNGLTRYSLFGSAVSGGDINGDGISDIVIGEPRGALDGDGRVYVLFGKSGGWTSGLTATTFDGGRGFMVTEKVGSQTGLSLDATGDINGDGNNDVIIGTGASVAYILFGNDGTWPSSVDLLMLDGTDGFSVTGGGGYRRYANSPGDINGDGLDDILIGNQDGAPNDVGGAGESYLIFGCNYTSQPCVK